MTNATAEQKAEILDIYPRVKTGASDSIETTKRMVRLHNQMFNTGYKETTTCSSCLSTILKQLKISYETIIKTDK